MKDQKNKLDDGKKQIDQKIEADHKKKVDQKIEADHKKKVDQKVEIDDKNDLKDLSNPKNIRSFQIIKDIKLWNKFRRVSKWNLIDLKVFIWTTFNNTTIYVYTKKGDLIYSKTPSSFGLKGTKWSSPYGATLVVNDFIYFFKTLNVKMFDIVINGRNSNWYFMLKKIGNIFIIRSIEDNQVFVLNGVWRVNPKSK